MKYVSLFLATLSLYAQITVIPGPTGGGGSGGAGMTFSPARTSPTILTLPAIAANTIRMGPVFCDALASATFTVSSGSGSLWVSVTPGTGTTCVLTVRHDVVGSCSAGCTAVGSSSGFLQVDYPLYQWAVSAAALASSGTNRVNVNASFPLAAGANMTQTCDTSGLCTWAAASSSYDPIDSTQELVIENFFPTHGAAGELGWTLQGSGAATSLVAGVANHPGLLRITSASGNSASIDLVAAGPIGFHANPFAVANWEMVWVFRGNTAAAAVNIGLFSSNAFANYVLLGGVLDSGNWSFNFCSASCGAATTVSSGVAAVTADWVKFRLRSLVAGTVLASVSLNGGAYSTEKSLCAASCDASGTVPVVALSPFFYTYNAGASTTLDADFHRSLHTGLTR